LGNIDVVINDGDSVFNTTGTIERISTFPSDLSFDAETLAGVYEVVGTNSDNFSETFQYTFKEDGTVKVVYGDGGSDDAFWSVNSDGQLVFSGPFDDVFTLTSGNQSSGNIDVVINDGDSVFNTTGTIERIEGINE
jgi:hypothetical protein